VVAAHLSGTRLPRGANVPRGWVERFRIEYDGEHSTAVCRADQQNRAFHAGTRVADRDSISIVDLPNLFGSYCVGGELVDRRLRDEQDGDEHAAPYPLLI